VARVAGDPSHVRPGDAVYTDSGGQTSAWDAGSARDPSQGHKDMITNHETSTRVDEVASAFIVSVRRSMLSRAGSLSIRTSSLMMNLCCSTPDTVHRKLFPVTVEAVGKVLPVRHSSHRVQGARPRWSGPPRVRDIDDVISADELALALVRGIERGGTKVVRPFSAYLIAAINTLFPSLVDLYLSWLGKSTADVGR